MTNNDWYRYHARRQVPPPHADQLHTDRVAAEDDIAALLARTELQPDARILEIGCGWGRHALALAQRGFKQVRSIDIAPEPLQLARTLARELEVDAHFRQQDFMAVDDGPYNAIISLYDRSVCGFPTEAEDAQSLQHLSTLLAPEGWLVFGINDWPFHLPAARRDWRWTDDGLELIEVVPDRVMMTCTDRVTLVRQNGQQECHALTRRHYSLPELRRLLADTGFAVQVVAHRLIGHRPYGDGGDGLFVFARRADTPVSELKAGQNARSPEAL